MNEGISRRHFLFSSGCTIATLLFSPMPIVNLLMREATAAAAGQIEKQGLPPKVIEGLLIDLTPELVPQDRSTVVWGDTIHLIGRLQTKGHHLVLIARIIRFQQEGALVDTMADSPIPDYPPGTRAKDGANLGDNGDDGGNSGHGGDAGDVLIFANHIDGQIDIRADGQRGGNARSGGNGQTGGPGPDATADCANGGTGLTGGRGGLAGTPGNGGNGGRVQIFCAQPESIMIKSISVDLGPPGAPGEHGTSWEGGIGGAPGGPGYCGEEIRFR